MRRRMREEESCDHSTALQFHHSLLSISPQCLVIILFQVVLSIQPHLTISLARISHLPPHHLLPPPLHHHRVMTHYQLVESSVWIVVCFVNCSAVVSITICEYSYVEIERLVKARSFVDSKVVD